MIRQILTAFGYEKRSEPYADPRLSPSEWGFALRPGAGLAATPASVLSNSAVATRCVALRSELLASVPLRLYRKLPNGDRERVTDVGLAAVLGDLANPLQTAFEAREFLIRSLDMAGNAYALIDRDGAGQVVGITPLAPSRVQVERLENGRLRYRYSLANNAGGAVALMDDMLHIRASSEDGFLGRSPLMIARDSFRHGLNLNAAANNIAEGGMKITGFVTHPGRLSDKAKSGINESLLRDTGGTANAGKVKVLEEGMKWFPVQWSAQEAQLLESIELSNVDVAHAFNVPPAVLGLHDSVSYGSAQQAAADLVQNALAPLASRIEQAMARCLLTPAGRAQYLIEHDLSGLLRGDQSARWATYKVGREIGAISSEEVRRFENLGPKNAGEDYAPVRSTSGAASSEPVASAKP